MIRQSPDFLIGTTPAYRLPSQKEPALRTPRLEVWGRYINDTFRQVNPERTLAARALSNRLFASLLMEDSETGEGNFADGLRFYVGVDNVLNQLPPLGSTATGVGSAIYDFRGRSFYAGARARF